MTLLICEDEREIREGLRDTVDWGACGIGRVLTAADGWEARELIRSEVPDILLTDIRMPRLDGLALSRFVYEHYPAIRIVILSGYGEFEYARRAIAYKVEHYFIKPVPIGELTGLMRRLCGGNGGAAATGGAVCGDAPSLGARIKGYIDEHACEAINIDVIARALGVNASYLSHSFKRETGIRCSEYLNRIRVRRSLEPLLKSRRTIEEIAGASGFSNGGYYITVFKKIMGMTPQQYRNRRR